MREIVKEVAGYVESQQMQAFRLSNPEQITSIPSSHHTDPQPHPRLAPYERRVIELLRNSKDKRARKLAKKRVSQMDVNRLDCGTNCEARHIRQSETEGG